mgnify:FL=1
MDDNRPKRRKSKDNPYTIFEENGKFYVAFKDGQGNENKVEVNNDVFSLFDDNELHDISQLNEFDRHIEHSEQSEVALYKKTMSDNIPFEDIIFSKIRNGRLKKMLVCLPPLQRERVILFYWKRFTCSEIAEIQGCTRQAVSLSIRRARKRLKEEILKKENI